MKPIDMIYAELRREQRKLNMMPLTDRAALLRQSQVVDRLVVEYHRAMRREQGRGQGDIPA